MKKYATWIWRILFYILGLLTLALGIILNTKAELGVSPIISVAYTVSKIMDWNFANATFWLYVILVALQFVLKGKNYKWYDILQIPLSLVFTRFINVFDTCISFEFANIWQKIVVLLIGVILTGIGAALSVNVKLIPNPGDGIVFAFSQKIKKSLGFSKNLFDTICITTSIVIGALCHHFLVGIGIGTVIAVIGVGRVIAVFNHFTKKKLDALMGL